MILTYVGNTKELSNRDIIEIIRNERINTTSAGILAIELKTRLEQEEVIYKAHITIPLP